MGLRLPVVTSLCWTRVRLPSLSEFESRTVSVSSRTEHNRRVRGLSVRKTLCFGPKVLDWISRLGTSLMEMRTISLVNEKVTLSPVDL